jgi:hypothetical protein
VEALPVPADSFFKLEQTTIVINDASAAQVATFMLDFLRGEVGGLITKVNPTKLTIKADICLDNLNFELKVRIYRSSCAQHVVEMQRRSGDSIAFHHLYRWTSQRFSSCSHRLGLGEAIESHHSTEPHVELEGSIDTEGTLEPLLDLASSANPQLQVEAAQGLLLAAADTNLALQLCAPQAFTVIQNLLQIVCFSIAEPLARVMCCLAVMPEAKYNFTNHHLLQSMIQKIWAPTTGQNTSCQFAQIVCQVVTHYVAELSIETSQKLASALTQKLSGEAPETAADAASTQSLQTICYLQDSLQVLSLSRPLQMAQACC